MWTSVVLRLHFTVAGTVPHALMERAACILSMVCANMLHNRCSSIGALWKLTKFVLRSVNTSMRHQPFLNGPAWNKIVRCPVPYSPCLVIIAILSCPNDFSYFIFPVTHIEFAICTAIQLLSAAYSSITDTIGCDSLCVKSSLCVNEIRLSLADLNKQVKQVGLESIIHGLDFNRLHSSSLGTPCTPCTALVRLPTLRATSLYIIFLEVRWAHSRQLYKHLCFLFVLVTPTSIYLQWAQLPW